MSRPERGCLAKTCRFFIELLIAIFYLLQLAFYQIIVFLLTICLTKCFGEPLAPTSSPEENKTISIATNVIFSDGYTPYEEAVPCSRCRAINLTDLTSPSGYAHCEKYDELHSAAEEGCKLCTLLLLAIERSEAKKTATFWMGFRSKMSYETRPRLTLVSRGNGRDGGLKSDLVEVRLEKMDGAYEGPRTVSSELLAVVGLYADEYSPARALISGRRILCDSSATDAISMRERWIKEILHDDDISCRELQTDNEELPKRVLDISRQSEDEEDTIKLIEITDSTLIQGRYIALSHCWGREGHFRLTESTLNQMKTGLPTSSLAKNFRDAITITRLLGLRYLWIDALCILQDSQIDWELESAKMGQYYERAWLTIAAGMSDGGKHGLLAKRSPHGLPHVQLKVQANAARNSGVCQKFTVYFALDPIKPSTQCPIRTRGWTFQEELLSRRYLSFETTQTYLRCGTIVHHECGRQEDLLKDESPFMEGERLLQRKDWLEIVRRYSSRNLTKESDKLPALSGLAHEYCRRWGGEYLAGLWRQDLCRDLLWRRNEMYTLPEPRRPEEYRAPSWSWASLDGRIEFAGPANVHDEFKIRIDSVKMDLAGSDPMGQVFGGTIKVRGVVSKMDSYGNIPKRLGIKLRKHYDVPGEVKPENPPRDQYLLWICKRSGLIVRCALVQPEGERFVVLALPRKEFQRVGYFSSSPSSELDEFWSNVKLEGLHEHRRFIYPEVIYLV
ncbi:heterokaryon incompatibility protein-domain-containing protein [Rhexocercosporidium sp. MPI-PUGE-AT-0058]|nr:heterokaryon incompatibility protein-domain-containing protein [Rhexocercosporidium sp. MPI-PUGE-AT-0058]